MQAHLWAALGTGTASPFATVALLAGGVVGALLRVMAERVMPPESPAVRWIVEAAVAATFGALLGMPFSLSMSGSGWAGSGFGGAMNAYAGASAAYGYLRARGRGLNPAGQALAHFLAAITATTVGFVLVVALLGPRAR